MGNPNIGELGKNTRFGAPNGNKPNGGGALGGGKTFRQMIGELMFMSEEELKEYSQNKKNPMVVRRAAVLLVKMKDIKDLSTAADIIESKPTQVIENKITQGMTIDEFASNINNFENE